MVNASRMDTAVLSESAALFLKASIKCRPDESVPLHAAFVAVMRIDFCRKEKDAAAAAARRIHDRRPDGMESKSAARSSRIDQAHQIERRFPVVAAMAFEKNEDGVFRLYAPGKPADCDPQIFQRRFVGNQLGSMMDRRKPGRDLLATHWAMNRVQIGDLFQVLFCKPGSPLTPPEGRPTDLLLSRQRSRAQKENQQQQSSFESAVGSRQSAV